MGDPTPQFSLARTDSPRLRAAAVKLFTLCSLLLAFPAGAQITLDPIVTGEATAVSQIENALVGPSSGITVADGSPAFVGLINAGGQPCTQSALYTNFDLIPDPNSTTGASRIVMEDGVLFTAGCAELPESNTQSAFGQINSTGSDPDLAALVTPTTINDVNSFAFDFTVDDPSNDAVRITFVFGSDEFPETGVTDIFGFFVDGANYAMFPNGTLVNFAQGQNEDQFNDNSTTPFAYPIEYDGLSDALTICAPLDPERNTHSLKIAVADTSDSILDSGVFITDLRAGEQGEECGSIEVPSDFEVSVDPAVVQEEVDGEVTLTATVEAEGSPLVGAQVTFEVTNGPNEGTTETVSTDENGEATFTLSSPVIGVDVVEVSAEAEEIGSATSPDVRVRWGSMMTRFEANGWGEAVQRYTGGFGQEVGLIADSDDVLFFAAQTDGVYILDISDPFEIVELGHYDPETCDANGVEVPFFADDVFFEPTTFFLESPDPNGTPDPNSPDPNGVGNDCGIDCETEGIKVMHVAAAECGVHIVSLADLDQGGPQFLAAYGGGGSAEAVEVYARDGSGDPCSADSRNVAVVASTDSLDLVDVSDPLNPLFCSTIPNTDESLDDSLVVAVDVFMDDPEEEEEEAEGLPEPLVHYALVATGDGGRLASIEDPSMPEITGGYLTPVGFSPWLVSQHIRAVPQVRPDFGLLSSWAAGFQVIGVDEEIEEAELIAREPTESAVFSADMCGFDDFNVCIADGQMGVKQLGFTESPQPESALGLIAEFPIGKAGAFAWDVEADGCTVAVSYGVYEGVCEGGSDDGDVCFASAECAGDGECVFPGGVEVHELPTCELLITETPPAPDADFDGTPDSSDNCIAVSNDQSDVDQDGYGDACDADLSNDGAVGLPDFSLLLGQMGGAGSGDLSGDGVVGLPDLGLMTNAIGGTPGPSGLACAGRVPCP